jgi:hypothetical protein
VKLNNAVLVPVAITFAVTALADLVSRGGLRLSVLLGNLAYATFLLAFNEINTDVTMAFAWVVVITVLLTNGQVVFSAIQKGIK